MEYFLDQAAKSIDKARDEAAPEWATAFLLESLGFSNIAIARQLEKLNAKVERMLALVEIATHCIVDLLPPDGDLPPGLCPICPRCDLPGEKCICDEVPGQ